MMSQCGSRSTSSLCFASATANRGFAFDLWAHEDVSGNAAAILERVRNGTMPCDGAWPLEKVENVRALDHHRNEQVGFTAQRPNSIAMGKTRVEAFSDGVIAVAITLLALDLHVPAPMFGVGSPAPWPRSGPTMPPTRCRF